MNQPKCDTDLTSSATLLALNKVQPNIYAGTVPPATVAKRRVKNKKARASRRANRSK